MTAFEFEYPIIVFCCVYICNRAPLFYSMATEESCCIYTDRLDRRIDRIDRIDRLDRIEFDLNGLQVGVVVIIGLVISTFFVLFRVIDGRGLLCP